MIAGRIEGATRYLGAPVGWTPEDDGDCAHLAIRDDATDNGVPFMESAWEPTPAEVAAIVAGASIRLMVVGRAHPPVMLSVGVAP